MRNIWIKKRNVNYFSYVIPIVFIAFFLLIMSSIVINQSKKSEKYEEETLRENLSKMITICYSIEGRYPPSIEYIEENYGFSYDKDTYFIHYEMIGSNLMPMYEVFFKERRNEE